MIDQMKYKKCLFIIRVRISVLREHENKLDFFHKVRQNFCFVLNFCLYKVGQNINLGRIKKK